MRRKQSSKFIARLKISFSKRLSNIAVVSTNIVSILLCYLFLLTRFFKKLMKLLQEKNPIEDLTENYD